MLEGTPTEFLPMLQTPLTYALSMKVLSRRRSNASGVMLGTDAIDTNATWAKRGSGLLPRIKLASWVVSDTRPEPHLMRRQLTRL